MCVVGCFISIFEHLIEGLLGSVSFSCAPIAVNHWFLDVGKGVSGIKSLHSVLCFGAHGSIVSRESLNTFAPSEILC